ncbi:hypothetical protein HPB47_008397 [Ixodes persulcatus]|uniref:Uncharacterized protein n=1 Tax=Ixodes persulcatus TaxID=34615 RepID=A0AC60P4X9_IXOPE|nr:hypothetical protein HPB47_008397 [Ixodes persulcatus]
MAEVAMTGRGAKRRIGAHRCLPTGAHAAAAATRWPVGRGGRRLARASAGLRHAAVSGAACQRWSAGDRRCLITGQRRFTSAAARFMADN